MKHEKNTNNIIYDQLGKLNVYEYLDGVCAKGLKSKFFIFHIIH